MVKELDCNIVKDLLPLYVDGMLSDESKRSVENHIKICSSCKEIYENMIAPIDAEKAPELSNVKKYLNRTKLMYFLYGLIGIGFIAIMVCLIVDLSMNGKVTWSFIPGTSIIYADAIIGSLLICKKNKLLKTMMVISIGAVLLLIAIQISRYYMIGTGDLWIFKYGMPIMILWIVAVWIPVLLWHFFKLNVCYCISILLLVAIAGNYMTKLITGDFTKVQDLWSISHFIESDLGNIIGAIIFAVVGKIITTKNTTGV